MPTLLAPRFSVSLLTLAVGTCFAVPAAAQDNTATLPEVVVSASKADLGTHASVAGFTATPLLDTPASVAVFGQQQMQAMGIRTTTDASKYDASISDAYNAVGYAEQFSIRGFELDNNSSYRKDGLALPADTQIPLENKERIEVLKGLSGLQAGVAAPGGIIDYITKRPTATPLRTVTIEESERGTLYGTLDVGGRFADPRFGYRINVATERLRSYVKGADGHRNFISGAFDFQLSPQALLQVDVDFQRKEQVSVPGFQLLNGTTLPVISAGNMTNNQPWSKPVKTTSSNIGLRYTYQFSPDWHATLAANQHNFKRDDYTAFPYGCAAQNLYPGFCGNGDYDVWDYISLGESKTPLAAQAMLQGKLTTAGLRHDVTFGTSFFKREDKYGDYVYQDVGTSNIYQPVAVPSSGLTSGPVSTRRTENERALFVQDIVTLAPQWTVHAGVRYTKVKRDEFVAADVPDATTNGGFWIPNVALVYKPLADLSLYTSYAQGLEHGGIAPIETTNQNQALTPAKSKQIELGAKYELTPAMLLSAALFQIRKGLEYTDASNTYVRNGTAQNRGLELSAQGQVSRDLTLGLSAMLLNTKQEGTGQPDFDGKHVVDVAPFKSSVFADYALPQVAGLSVNGSWQHSGGKYFDQDNTVAVPGYHVFNFGLAYATKVGATAAIVRADVNNAFDKFYWRDVTQELGGYLLPGASRTFKVSVQFMF